MRGRRRWLHRIVLPLLVGCVCTVGTAIAGVAGGPLGTPAFTPVGSLEELWLRQAMPTVFRERGDAIGVGRWSPEATFMGQSIWAEERELTLGAMREDGAFLDASEHLTVWRFRVGWPFRWAEMSRWSSETTAVSSGIWESALISNGLPGIPSEFRALPLVGTLAIMTVGAWALLVLPGDLRARRRAARGECVACGHKLANLEQCPECGEPAPATTARREDDESRLRSRERV